RKNMFKSRVGALYGLMFAMALGTGGCGSDPAHGPGRGGEGGGGSAGNGGTVSGLRIAGTYHPESNLDVRGGFEGGAGFIFRTIEDVGNHSDAPAGWLIDAYLESQKDHLSDFERNLIIGSRRDLTNFINGELSRLAPNFINTIRQFGQALGAIVRHVGFGSDLVISVRSNSTASSVPVTYNHTLRSVFFTFMN